ncbi:MAG: phosphoglucosamine mutase [Bacteroidota bacterium]
MSTLMVSVSGIRGIVGNGLDPNVLVKYTSAYADLCGPGKIVVGRDSRITGDMVEKLVVGTLLAKGNDVITIGICPTPTVLFNVKILRAVGGIAISASHNPNEWNALKLLNSNGEFLTPEENQKMLGLLDYSANNYARWDKVGKSVFYSEGLLNHVEAVLSMPYLDIEGLNKRNFRVLLDCVNGAGSYVMEDFLLNLGCDVIPMNCERTGIFPRLPEPIPENLTETMRAVKENKVDLGIVVDPDVDRLVLITDKGEPFGEENTVSQAVRFILSKQKGNVVVNLSTTRAVNDIANEYGCKVFRSSVGEANVVQKMKEVGAVIGGEGSGGVIFPAVQFGRDALVGSAIILQQLLEFGGTISELKESMPEYSIVKSKIELGKVDHDLIIENLIETYSAGSINTDDGLRIDFEDHWVHFRKSNTEPIMRCIVEAESYSQAEEYSEQYFEQVKKLLE